MDLLEELMASERRLAHGRGAEYRDTLTEDALVIVPGAVLDKDQCVAAMDESPGWDSVDMDEARLIESHGVAVVVYRFRGVRAGDEYRATLASSYWLPDRTLFLHQQTPDA